MEILINEETYLNNIGFLSNKHMNNLCDNSRFIQESKLSQIVDSEPLLVDDMFIIDYGKYIAKKIKSKQSITDYEYKILILIFSKIKYETTLFLVV